MSTSVKWFHSGMPGAPVLSGTAGALLAVLDACLVDGFGLGTVDSIVISGGIATVTRGAGHSFEPQTVALLSGVSTPPGLNGEHKVLTTTPTSYTFATTEANQTATGTITHKLAPAGWEKQFTGSNLRAYRSLDITGTRCVLRVDDTNAQSPRVVGYESMTDINTGVGPFPTPVQMGGGAYWIKSTSATGNVRSWIIFADSRAFSYSCAWDGSTRYGTYFFGDILPTKSPDPYACILVANSGTMTSSPPGSYSSDTFYSDPASTSQSWLPRNVYGIGNAVAPVRYPMACLGGAQNWSGSAAVANKPRFPNPADNKMYTCRIGVTESESFRGQLPGLMHILNVVGQSVFSVLENVDLVEHPDRVFKVVSGTGYVGLIDVTGPWR